MSKALHQIYCLGDSITQGSSTSLAWPWKLRTLIGPGSWNVNNLGVGGNTAAQIDARATSSVLGAHSALLAGQKKIFIQMTGTNNLVKASPDNVTTTFNTAKAAIDTAIAAGNWSAVLWCYIPPCGRYIANNGFASSQAAIDSFNAMIAAYAPGEPFRAVNTYTPLEDSTNADYLSEGGTNGNMVLSDVSGSNDYLHPNNLGATAIAAAIHETLLELGVL